MRERILNKSAKGPRAVFLDRDGTINVSLEFFKEPEKVVLERNAAAGIKKMNGFGIPVIVVSNQPVVARGLCSEKDVEEINSRLLGLLAKEGAKIDAIYWCPHSAKADVQDYRKECKCRKPATGMLEAAAKRFGLKLGACFVAGDSVRDMLMGKRAGCTTIALETGDACSDAREDVPEPVEPDYMAKDLLIAAGIIEKLVSGNSTISSRSKALKGHKEV